MKYYVFKLIPPRPSFVADITDEERALMGAHGQYLAGHQAQGRILVFGPVLDAAGPYGLAVARLPDDFDPKSITDADPLIKSGRGFRYEISPMLTAMVAGALG